MDELSTFVCFMQVEKWRLGKQFGTFDTVERECQRKDTEVNPALCLPSPQVV